MPELKDDELGQMQILKPGSKGLALGDKMRRVKIIGGHKYNEEGLRSLPVQVGEEKMAFPLNKSNAAILSEATKETDTDNWKGFQMDLLVVQRTNPQTKEPVLGFSVLPDSVTKE